MDLRYIKDMEQRHIMMRCGNWGLVIYAEKRSLSTANADPAGTLVAIAASMIKDPSRSISSFKRPTALVILSERKELEHTNSANPGE